MPSLAFTVASRVIRQLTRDRRTLALIFIVPLVVMTLIGLSFPETTVLDYIAPALLTTLALFFGF
jgi:ABC-2 type transport system permease protein